MRRSRHDVPGADGIDTSGSNVLGPLHPERLGHTAHELVYAGIERGLVQPSGEVLLDLWRGLGQEFSEPTYRQVERQVAISRADCFFHYTPLPESWTVMGFEFALGDEGDERGRVDIACEVSDGRVGLVELKTGYVTDATLAALAPQLDRYCTLALERWGETFLGIRVCLLAAPLRSRFAEPDGTHRPLLSEPEAEA